MRFAGTLTGNDPQMLSWPSQVRARAVGSAASPQTVLREVEIGKRRGNRSQQIAPNLSG